MTKIKTEPNEIWSEYEEGRSYKNSLKLYDNVEQNEKFYSGDQWSGVKAPDLVKPVFNFLKPVINYYIAMLISDDIATNIEISDNSSDGAQMDDIGVVAEQEDSVPDLLSAEINSVMEQANVKTKNRKMIRNCAVDGDACFYVWFDPDVEMGFGNKGQIKVDLIDNTNVIFGDCTEADPQLQPYIIIPMRKLIGEVKEMARKNGLDDSQITPDADGINNGTSYSSQQYVTMLLKLWRENGTIHFSKSTAGAQVQKPTDTKCKLYPIAWMSWESIKNSYHGVSPITWNIQNQMFVNKSFALAMIQMQNLSFPMAVYNKQYLPKYDPTPGQAVGVNGPPDNNMINYFRPPDMSAQVTAIIDLVIKYSKDMMGASDAALGNVKPDNTSAIVAVQKAAGLPLDIQRMDFHNFVESYIRIFIDMMRAKYGIRSISVKNKDGTRRIVEYDFSKLENINYHLDIDIGQGSYWSELMQIQTLDNLKSSGIIPDAITYLEAVPDGYIKNKKQIIEKIKEMQEQAMEQQALVDPPTGDDIQPAALPAENQLTDEQVAQAVQGLGDTSPKDAVAVVNEMMISEEDKGRILQALGG